jgi:hypothetical protein
MDQLACALECPLAQGFFLVDKQEAALGLVFVARDLGASREGRGVLAIGLHPFKKAAPIVVKLNQDSIADFARQGTIGLMLFQAMEDGGVGQIGPLVKEGLPDVVIGLVVQVFRGKGCPVNDGKACILVTDEMSFD